MSRRNFYRDPGYGWDRSDLERERRERERREQGVRERDDWDREHWERSMDIVRNNQKDDAGYSSVGGTPYQGGVFSSGSYGSGAEFYSITGMYENPLMGDKTKKERHHRGKGPKNYKRSDDRIHDEVCERLTRHPLVDASMMDVHVKDGEVTLTGEVHDRRMRYMAEDVVDGVAGVKEIHNELRVTRDRIA
jgi:osmotically-inducible protein OsmY